MAAGRRRVALVVVLELAAVVEQLQAALVTLDAFVAGEEGRELGEVSGPLGAVSRHVADHLFGGVEPGPATRVAADQTEPALRNRLLATGTRR